VCAQSNVLNGPSKFSLHMCTAVCRRSCSVIGHLAMCTAETAVETNKTEEHLLYTNHGVTASVVVHV